MARKLESPKKQTFSLDAPSAERVLLVGSFTKWQQDAIPMKKGKDGVWAAKVELPPGSYSYRFIVDGEWWDDPECEMRAPNPFGSQDMVRQVA